MKNNRVNDYYSHSHAVQFPLDEKLKNGKHRFFYKHGMLVDRLA